MNFCTVFLTTDTSLGRINKDTLTDQSLMELMIDGLSERVKITGTLRAFIGTSTIGTFSFAAKKRTLSSFNLSGSPSQGHSHLTIFHKVSRTSAWTRDRIMGGLGKISK